MQMFMTRLEAAAEAMVSLLVHPGQYMTDQLLVVRIAGHSYP